MDESRHRATLGPEDPLFDWDAVDWRTAESEVRRLRQRIFAASQAGDLKKVRSLQKLLLRSRSNVLLSVRRVMEVNAGRKTAGVDGKVVVSHHQKTELADWVRLLREETALTRVAFGSVHGFSLHRSRPMAAVAARMLT
jgi:hypothetical protein